MSDELTDEQIEEVFQQCADADDEVHLRFGRAMYEDGLRAGKLVQLDAMDSRKAFEAWAVAQNLAFRDKNGVWPLCGGTFPMNRLFDAWQAALSAQPVQEATQAPSEHRLRAAASDASEGADACHGLDTPERVRFYEHDFYVLSNFSAFNLRWRGRMFSTSEHAYHWEKFSDDDDGAMADLSLVRRDILFAPSAHEAFKVAERNRVHRRVKWDDEKVDVMRRILRAKAEQHEYVRRKLLATGDRELVEDSWRDDFWGWGPNRDGQNMLGKLWMEVRAEIRAAIAAEAGEKGE